MNTLEFDIDIISIISIDMFSFSELFFISVWWVSLKCSRNSDSSMLLRL